MTVDFLDASNRHHSDASFLFEDHRYPNADQLYGLAAECALKDILRRLYSGTIDKDGFLLINGKKVKGHVNEFWGVFSGMVSGRTESQFGLFSMDAPFGNWSVHQRYTLSSDISKETVEAHKRASDAIFETRQSLILDGVI